MLPTAISMKPSATCSGARVSPVAPRISSARAVNFARTTTSSSGASPRGPNTRGKNFGWIFSEHDVAVGHRERAAAAVACRTRIGAGRVRADAISRSRRNAGSSRRPPPRCECSSWARACARPRPGSRTRVPDRSIERRQSATTSVDVPPMSKPMILSKPAASEARTAPTTPPAAPTECCPFRQSAAHR